jgi:hypothetical protein
VVAGINEPSVSSDAAVPVDMHGDQWRTAWQHGQTVLSGSSIAPWQHGQTV